MILSGFEPRSHGAFFYPSVSVSQWFALGLLQEAQRGYFHSKTRSFFLIFSVNTAVSVVKNPLTGKQSPDLQ